MRYGSVTVALQHHFQQVFSEKSSFLILRIINFRDFLSYIKYRENTIRIMLFFNEISCKMYLKHEKNLLITVCSGALRERHAHVTPPFLAGVL